MIALVLAGVALLSGCRPQPLYTPEVQVRPESIGYGAHFAVRLYGGAIARYRFLGASQGPDGVWTVRIAPLDLGFWTQSAEFTVRTGDALPLGPDPAVLVAFQEIHPTRLTLHAVKVYLPGPDR
ncbi:MAG TPA: hypothetical protein VGK74_20735 [Symbiobacteriaceae bacterium]